MTGPDEAERWAERAAAIVEIARSAGAGGPPPRGTPFFGLDHRSETPLGLVDDLATRGIFRKYEHVLDLGAGLGATTRYLTTRLGCTATATATTPAEAMAGRLLTARAALDWQVGHVVADATDLPFAEAAFTHVWAVEALAGLGPNEPVLREAFRVLRPGGHLCVQDIVLRNPEPGLAEPAFVERDVLHRQLEATGFLEIVHRDVASPRVPEGTRGDAAWQRLVRRLGADDAFVRARRQIADALASGRAGLVQLTARRP